MKAVVYKEPYQVAVEEVPEPAIQAPDDAIIKITSTNICGSDLHMYEGRTSVDQGKILGHENMGIVEETGPGVRRIRESGRHGGGLRRRPGRAHGRAQRAAARRRPGVRRGHALRSAGGSGTFRRDSGQHLRR
jgi:NADPH:quinone reductase-like Zn-dependent oxidoreductase